MKNRNIVLAIIFTLLSCGIYGIYWFINVNDDMNTLTPDDSYQTSGGLAFLWNQFIFITSPFIIYFIIKNYLCWLLNITFKLNKAENVLIFLLLIGSIIFTIARNII